MYNSMVEFICFKYRSTYYNYRDLYFTFIFHLLFFNKSTHLMKNNHFDFYFSLNGWSHFCGPKSNKKINKYFPFVILTENP